MKRITLLIILIVCTNSSFATNLRSEEAKILAKKLRLSINKTMARIIDYEKQSGVTGEDLNLIIQQEPVMDSMLGAVLDVKDTVVVISPESNAKSLGLRVGDTIKQLLINGKPANFKKGFRLESENLLEAVVIRDSKKVSLTSNVSTSLLPAWKLKLFNDTNSSDNQLTPLIETSSGECGRVSVFFNPPETKRIYPSFIAKIDDKNWLRERQTIRLKPGKHKVYTHELIPARELRRRKFSMNKPKLLEINVEPNKTYYLGAQFIGENRYKQKNAEYWEPVVWKVTDKNCKL